MNQARWADLPARFVFGYFVLTANTSIEAQTINYPQTIQALYREPVGTLEFSMFDKNSDRTDRERACRLYEKYFDASIIERKDRGFCDIRAADDRTVLGFFRFPGYDAAWISNIVNENKQIGYRIGNAEKFGAVVAVPSDIMVGDSYAFRTYYFFDPARADGKVVNVLAFNTWPLDMSEAEGYACGIQSSHYEFSLQPDTQDFYTAIPAPCDRIEWDRHKRYKTEGLRK